MKPPYRSRLSALVPAGVLALAAGLPLAANSLAAQQQVQLPARDRGLALPTRTLFQVGEFEGEDYENFANVTDVAFDAAGNLYVLDPTAYRVVVFDARGKYLRTIGRQGEGPGEFGLPTALAVLPSGELVVNDAAKSNLQIFGPDGTFRRTAVVDSALGRANGRMRLSPAGGIITETMQLRQLANRGERGAAPARLQLPPRVVTRLTIGESATGQKLFTAPPRDLKLSSAKAGEGGMHVSMSATAFEPSLLWTPTADGGVAALNDEAYRVTIVDRLGKPVRSITRALAPRKVTGADRKQFLENQKQGIGGGAGMMVAVASRSSSGAGHAPSSGTFRVGPTELKETDVTWNDVIPVISALGADSFGRLWVQRTGQDLRDGPIDIIDAGGRYLGTLAKQQMPRAFGPGGRLAYLIKDDLDVQRVVVKQLLR